ncbi:hypothetical protein [Anaeromyxobacter oryzae]|uniref:Uncharacterized protein n=1 Tax=Anaeromyxobacter oryzae TaxID=2918170 RepID=A0ABM7WV79_9BACT|nr:hypothetical protein [Anaeromyxobacter oryzae]BDG03378.1 hypothetical protein AMOR_23740 [Anaeromyxobacter oryzae]
MAYTVFVLEVESGREHALPADAVTVDEPVREGCGPLVPLGFRSRDDVFYVRHERWPELEGRALRVRELARTSPRP